MLKQKERFKPVFRRVFCRVKTLLNKITMEYFQLLLIADLEDTAILEGEFIVKSLSYQKSLSYSSPTIYYDEFRSVGIIGSFEFF